MSADDFSAALSALDMDDRAFAALIGVNQERIKNYRTGVWVVPQQTALVLRLLMEKVNG